MHCNISSREKARCVDESGHRSFLYEVHHVHRIELREHAVELIAVADVDLLEIESVGLRD